MKIEQRGAHADQRETRFISRGIEVRAADDGSSVKVSGYAAVFDEETDIGGYFREVIRPGAFKDAIARGDDVVFLINHDGLPLSRTASKTLTVREDGKGLWMESTLDAGDPDVMRIVPKMKRGDLSKMSFAFSMYPDGETRWTQKGDDESELREILKVGRLYDVSIVPEPAYAGTEIALRSLEEARKAKAPRDADAGMIRRRMTLDLKARRLG
jgi:hypothetical protein